MLDTDTRNSRAIGVCTVLFRCDEIRRTSDVLLYWWDDCVTQLLLVIFDLVYDLRPESFELLRISNRCTTINSTLALTSLSPQKSSLN